MTTITCKMPERLAADLEALARRERRSKSSIIRQALAQRIRKTRCKAAPRAFDLVKSICGTLHGPRDLSTNPRHLEGLGA